MTIKPLAIAERPWVHKPPSKQTMRDRAEFLAFEIFNDRLAPEAEIADAIEREIRRFTHRAALTEPPA